MTYGKFIRFKPRFWADNMESYSGVLPNIDDFFGNYLAHAGPPYRVLVRFMEVRGDSLYRPTEEQTT